MPSHLEIELKWALSAPAHAALYQALASFIGPGERLQQENRFFDSIDKRLRSHLLNLRIRRENDRVLLTCKAKRPLGPAGAHQHQEWEEWLDPEMWEAVESGQIEVTQLPLPALYLEKLAGEPLVYCGGFSNERFAFSYTKEPLALLCLDKTQFNNNRIDYELEIECDRPQLCSDFWRQQLATWSIAYASQPLTKFARLLQVINE